MRHQIVDLMGGRTILSGSLNGRKLFSDLVAHTQTVIESEIAYLDFYQVEVATASFLREAVICYRDYARASLRTIYPVVANLSSYVYEELDFFVRARGDVLWSCILDKNNVASGARLIGVLDPALQATFDTMIGLSAVTATDIASRFPESIIGPTAWNNRLAALAAKGLIVERRQGRTKLFSPLLEVA